MKNVAFLLLLVAAHACATMDTQIAGRHIDGRGYEALHHPAANAYLYWALDCDGAHRRLTLTSSLAAIGINEGWPSSKSNLPERSLAENREEFSEAKFKSQTGLDITLGMTRKQVMDKLGLPSQSLYSKRFSAQELIYQRYTPKNKDGWYGRYANFYLFRNDRLYYIELSYDMIDGPCGQCEVITRALTPSTTSPVRP
ncbi:MAG: hypothetical protein ABIV13_01840 [Fimbriimonadales bacterium]